MFGMKRILKEWSKAIAAGVGVTLVMSLILAMARLKAPAARTDDNNPNKFLAWATNSSISYTFTYDPHAADVWLFHAGDQPVGTNTSLSNPGWCWKK